MSNVTFYDHEAIKNKLEIKLKAFLILQHSFAKMFSYCNVLNVFFNILHSISTINKLMACFSNFWHITICILNIVGLTARIIKPKNNPSPTYSVIMMFL